MNHGANDEDARMNRLAFACKHCSAELSDFLAERREPNHGLHAGDDLVPAGHYLKLDRSWTYQEFMQMDGGRYLSEENIVAFEAGDYLVNTKDVEHRMSAKAAYGCCGWQPRGELNAECENGHLIGTVHSDKCWSTLVFRLSAQHTEAIAL